MQCWGGSTAGVAEQEVHRGATPVFWELEPKKSSEILPLFSHGDIVHTRFLAPCAIPGLLSEKILSIVNLMALYKSIITQCLLRLYDIVDF